jgi:3-phenylpropionate/trans-cinnamate dioxygenase ferredoxin reductase subunit
MRASDERLHPARTFDCLVVGAGHAGAETAVSLRQLGFDGTVGLVGDEAVLPYERPAISKEYLAGKKDFAQLLLRPADYWNEHRVSLLLSTRVVDVDPIRRVVICEDGEVLGYRSLVWATGGTPRRLTCPGSDLSGVRSLRGKADCDDLLAVLPDTQRFVIVGGGYVGLEAAAVLRELRHEVTLVEALDRVLARVAGEPVSRFFENEHRTHGVDLRLGVGVSEVVGRDGRVEAVRLTDDTLIQAEQVIVGVGMEPAAGPLLAAGAAPGSDGRGVLVDTVCKSSLEDVYCVGDCAVIEGGSRIESRQNAAEQARAAALAICGRPEPLQMLPWFWSHQYDLRLQTVGLSHGHDELVVRGRPQDRSFTVAYLRDGALVALDCINSTRDFMHGRKLVEAGARITPDQLVDEQRSLKELAATA